MSSRKKKKQIKRDKKADSKKTDISSSKFKTETLIKPNDAIIKSDNENAVVPYEEKLFERARIQWQFGDWKSLILIDNESIQHHPDRAKIALFVAAGWLQTNENKKAREFLKLAQKWGAGKKSVNQILIAGIYNNLGRAAAIGNEQYKASKYFENAITSVTPGSEIELILKARKGEQLSQLGLYSQENCCEAKIDKWEKSLIDHTHLHESIKKMNEAIEQLEKKVDKKFKEQAVEVTNTRKLLKSFIQYNVPFAIKQLEASIGIHSYFLTGELPEVDPECHPWPIDADFALFIIELIELSSYDLIIEFGSGISTVIVAKVLTKIATFHKTKPSTDFISFDHHEQYYQQTLLHLKHSELAESVELYHAPLQEFIASDGKVYSFYDCQKILNRAAQRNSAGYSRILVIVDGPPSDINPHSRYPACPIILEHFKGAKIDILLDDYNRPEEKEIINIWQQQLEAAHLAFRSKSIRIQKGAYLLRIG